MSPERIEAILNLVEGVGAPRERDASRGVGGPCRQRGVTQRESFEALLARAAAKTAATVANRHADVQQSDTEHTGDHPLQAGPCQTGQHDSAIPARRSHVLMLKDYVAPPASGPKAAATQSEVRGKKRPRLHVEDEMVSSDPNWAVPRPKVKKPAWVKGVPSEAKIARQKAACIAASAAAAMQSNVQHQHQEDAAAAIVHAMIPKGGVRLAPSWATASVPIKHPAPSTTDAGAVAGAVAASNACVVPAACEARPAAEEQTSACAPGQGNPMPVKEKPDQAQQAQQQTQEQAQQAQQQLLHQRAQQAQQKQQQLQQQQQQQQEQQRKQQRKLQGEQERKQGVYTGQITACYPMADPPPPQGAKQKSASGVYAPKVSNFCPLTVPLSSGGWNGTPPADEQRAVGNCAVPSDDVKRAGQFVHEMKSGSSHAMWSSMQDLLTDYSCAFHPSPHPLPHLHIGGVDLIFRTVMCNYSNNTI